MLLNCDLAELEDSSHRVEYAVVPLIDQASIACGLHAGSPMAMHNTLAIAKTCGVTIGAHPGYSDRENFGRVSIRHTPEQLTALLHYQIAALDGMAKNHGLALDYVKPHGALYNDMMGDERILQTVLQALVAQHGPRKLMLLATGDAEKHQRVASNYGVELMFETFADRSYTDAGYLLPRQQAGAVLGQQRMLEQVQQLCEDHCVTTIGGLKLPIAADSLCVHGDTPEALQTIAKIRDLINSSRTSA